jgi:hypothetical protein
VLIPTKFQVRLCKPLWMNVHLGRSEFSRVGSGTFLNVWNLIKRWLTVVNRIGEGPAP